ncbi:MAG: hypothetical protein ACOCRO_08670 [Halanaerobiales bacterium]
MAISLFEVNKIYNCRRQLKVTYHPVEHATFRKFCLSVRDLQKRINEIGEKENWSQFLRDIKSYQFKLCASPLSFNNSSLLTEQYISSWQIKLSKYEQVYPDIYPLANQVLEQLRYLICLEENPLLDTCLDIALAVETENIAILVKQSNLVPWVENCLEMENLNHDFTVIVPSELKGLITYKTIIMIGTPNWFPEYILTSPRTYQLKIVSYDWLNINWQNEPIFENSDNFTEVVIQKPYTKAQIDNSIKNNLIEANEILPLKPNWREIADNFTSTYSDSNEDVIEAKLFVLMEQSMGILLNIQKKVFTITYHVSQIPELLKIPVSNIEPNMFILLRNNGDEDYITPLANQILGNKAEEYAQLQKEWKSKLKFLVKYYGIGAISEELVAKGLKEAKNQQNIRNWMSKDHIKPRKGFITILDYLDLGHRSHEFKEAATLIRKAHQKAGFYASKLLLNQLQKTDLSNLVKLGSMEIELEEVSGVSLIAYRVTEVFPEIKQIPASEVGKIIEL